MKLPLDLGHKQIDADQIVAIRPNRKEDRERLESTTGSSRNWTSRIVMRDNTSHNVENLSVLQVADAIGKLGIKTTHIAKDDVAIVDRKDLRVTYLPFGANSDLPAEKRIFHSEVRIGPVKIWLRSTLDELNASGRPVASLQELAEVPVPTRETTQAKPTRAKPDGAGLGGKS